MADALSPAELYDRLQRGESLSILDVRNRDEFEEWHIDAPRTIQTPYAQFMSAKVRGEVPELAEEVGIDAASQNGPIVAVCPQGDASEAVTELLREEGYDVRNLEDGMDGWATVYVAREIAGRPETVLQYERPSSGCLSYLVVSGEKPRSSTRCGRSPTGTSMMRRSGAPTSATPSTRTSTRTT